MIPWYLNSTNVFKIYQALSKHLDAHPDERKNWPNFAPERKTILAIGAKKPLEGEIHNAQYFHGRSEFIICAVVRECPTYPPYICRDGLGGISERHPEFNLNPTYGPTSVHPLLQLTEKSGAEVALEIIRSEPSRSITYIALGPLTTLAQIVNLDQATIRERIGSIMIMGGALDVPGNTSPVAECKVVINDNRTQLIAFFI